MPLFAASLTPEIPANPLLRSSQTTCTFYIAPSNGAQYIDISILELPSYQGSVFLYDSQGVSLVSANQATTGWVRPLRVQGDRVRVVWDGTSEKSEFR